MHDWRQFDFERGYEVRQLDEDTYQARHVDRPDEVTTLTAAEFEQWREAGPNPKGLD